MKNADKGTMAGTKGKVRRVRPLHTLKGLQLGRMCGQKNGLRFSRISRESDHADNRPVRMLGGRMQRGCEG